MTMRAFGRQLSKRWFFSTPNRKPPHQRGPKPRLQLEELESRLIPSVDLLGNAGLPDAIPAAFVVHSNGATPAGSGGQPGGFSPQQISQAYGFNQIYFNNGTIKGDGTGQTIAIVDAYSQPDITSDLQTFDSTFGLAAPPSFTVVNQNGGSNLPSAADQSWGLEASIDVEWAHAIAPGAKILLVETNSNSWTDLMAGVNYARNQSGVSVVSMSWYGSEWSGETAYDSYFTTPNGHTGVSFLACSGDNGSSGAPGFPADSPNVIGVGGTQLTTDSAGDYQSETGWSGSGGGISAYERQPSYQKGIVTQTSTMRAVPDVAYNGSPNSPYAVYDTPGYGGWLQAYGTSEGTPQWGALLAIADQGRALDGLGTLDGGTQTLPLLYQLQSDFHDITSGSNGAYSAGPGYDLVTGLGTPIANYLVPDLVYGAAPATPTGLTATAVSSSQINLTWNSPIDAHTYTVERSLDDSTWQVVTTVSNTSYSDTGLQANTTYYYRVLASNGFGSSSYSAPVNATTQNNSSSATFVKSDTTTQGNWQGVYGSQGYNVINDVTNYPSYANVSASGNGSWTWNNSTSDVRALQDASGSGRIAACWFSSTSYTINLNLTDGQTHQVALYLLDWDDWEGGRSEKIDILDASTGNVLSSETASNFQSGDYLVWNLSGNVVIRVTNLENSSTNAVISGLFFDPKGSQGSGSGSATFLKSDTTTQGNWQGVYGSQGYNVVNDAANYPSYAHVSTSDNGSWTWNGSTTDVRALQDANGSGRIAACWYSSTSFTINLNITDGLTHQVALYLLDWDNWEGGRSEEVDIYSAATGALLSSETASNFQGGEYLVWNISGDVVIRVTNLEGNTTNAVISGLFFDAKG